MGKKKDKNKRQDEKRGSETTPVGEDVSVSGASEASPGGGGAEEGPPDLVPQPGSSSSSSRGGKKGKKNRKKDDDWEDEMDALAREIDGGKPELPPSLEISLPDDPGSQESGRPAAEEEGGGGGERVATRRAEPGKKGKKKKWKQEEEDNWEDEVEAIACEIKRGPGAGSSEQLQVKQTEPDTQTEPEVKQAEPDATRTTQTEPEVKQTEPAVEVSATVMTPAQKRAAKKERERQKKKAKVSQQPATPQSAEPSVPESQVESTSSVSLEPPSLASAVAGDNSEDDDDAEDKKKKKKKKKKTAEEEKKSKVKKPGKGTILKMKERVEAVRAEQRRREEEEVARIQAEEEAERRRLEELRLEQERKEKRKQKEKERKERRRLEGKPVTKAEKDRLARANQQLQALKEQGVLVPEKKEEGGERRKVRYGSRVRPKKTKPVEGGAAAAVREEEEEEVVSMSGEPPAATEEEGGVKERWDEEEEEEGVQPGSSSGDVKDNWDDDSDHEAEEEEEEKTTSLSLEVASEGARWGGPAMEEEEEEEEVGGEGSEDEDSSSGSSSSSSDEQGEELSAYKRAKVRIERRRVRHKEERSEDVLRSPVVCVLGHVDTGKTKILDKIRRTNVQDGEAGGITQQIGATFVPVEAVREQTKMLKEFSKSEIKLPGLLIIDTPGHESFSNLRSRGSSMCDLAILVVDVMHGLEPQTLESLRLLTKGKTPFVVALNKIDRLFEWQRNPRAGVRDTLKRQKTITKDQFDERVQLVTTEFAEQGLNVALFWEKVDFSSDYVPVVPTSAISGDGMADLIALLVTFSQRGLSQQLRLSQEVEAIVMEVKVIAGLGTTMDVILRDGYLEEGDTMVLSSSEGPFVTTARALLMPQPLRELRVKNAYVNHKVILASQGIKVCAKELDRVVAGTPVLVAKKPDEVDVLKDEAAAAMSTALNAIQLQERGVFVQASTLGSLEALVEFLKQSKIPYAGVNIGPVHKKDVMRASVMLEHDSQWAVILAFDVRVERESQELADKEGVKIFTADIIYHLFDSFLKHRAELKEQKRKEFEGVAVFPCKLRIMPDCVFNTRDPIVVGVVVEAGLLKHGTPITVPSKSFTDVGVVSSLEINHKPVDTAGKGKEVCVKIEPGGGGAPRCYGRHFDHQDLLVSKISRESIDAVKKYFREDLQKEDWQLMIELKKTFQIM